jgi:hypothetical protein
MLIRYSSAGCGKTVGIQAEIWTRNLWNIKEWYPLNCLSKFWHNRPQKANNFQQTPKKKKLQTSLRHTTKDSINLLDLACSDLLYRSVAACENSTSFNTRRVSKFHHRSKNFGWGGEACRIEGPRSSVRVSEDRVPQGHPPPARTTSNSVALVTRYGPSGRQLGTGSRGIVRTGSFQLSAWLQATVRVRFTEEILLQKYTERF